MNKPAFLALTTLLCGIALGTACLGADSRIHRRGKNEPAGSKSGCPGADDPV